MPTDFISRALHKIDDNARYLSDEIDLVFITASPPDPDYSSGPRSCQSTGFYLSCSKHKMTITYTYAYTFNNYMYRI